jgi:hypothetical protein
MTAHGPESSSRTDADEAFARIYNDTDRFPNLTDVALELGISYQTVRNKSSILKGRAKRGEDVPVLISRVVVATQKDKPDPRQHANRRADILREEINELLTGSRYPVTNPNAVVIDSTISTRYDRLTGEREETEGVPRTWLTDTLRVERVADPRGRRFLFTGAQNDATVDPDFWRNLTAYADFLDADIVVGPGTYETQWWSENNPAVRAYDQTIAEFLCFGQMEIGDDFVFSGEMNMLPTANRPISDLTTYSKGKWTVFPHAKLQLKSVPSVDPAKQAHQVMTTGMVTRPKIIPRKAGIKALSYHTLGATIVEFDQDGDLFCRQITAGENGTFYDLEYVVSNGVVDLHDGVDLVVMGDLHTAKLQPANADATFRASTALTRVLGAKRAIAHDIFDNETRNHHHVHDNAYSYEMAVRGRESVFAEIEAVAVLLEELADQLDVTVVESNHDIALERYVKEGRYRNDGINIRLGLQLEDAYLAWREETGLAIDAGAPVESFSLLEYAVDMIADRKGLDLSNVSWVHDGYSFQVNGVELGNHGFRGANGARGTVAGFAALGRKMTIADKHAPEICDNVFVAGCMNLRQGYNKGPSGWAIAHVVQYPDGNRTLITLQNAKWRA